MRRRFFFFVLSSFYFLFLFVGHCFICWYRGATDPIPMGYGFGFLARPAARYFKVFWVYK